MSTAEDIKNKIWAMANELRGNMDASEYRDYILGFMFYRFLSEHQLNWQSENEFPDLAGKKLEKINQRYAKEAIGDDLTEYLKDIADALGYAIEPKLHGFLSLNVLMIEVLHHQNFKKCLISLPTMPNSIRMPSMILREYSATSI